MGNVKECQTCDHVLIDEVKPHYYRFWCKRKFTYMHPRSGCDDHINTQGKKIICESYG